MDDFEQIYQTQPYPTNDWGHTGYSTHYECHRSNNWRHKYQGGVPNNNPYVNPRRQPNNFNHSTLRGPKSGAGNGHKPWMTTELLAMIRERDQLRRISLNSNNSDDWSKFKAVQKSVSLALNDAKYLYEQGLKDKSKRAFYCDTCDRNFNDQNALDEHLAEHIVCKLDGCTFTAHPKLILKHIEMQHSNGLYMRVKGYQTPEDIQKWKNDRKKNYPTVESQKKKEAEREAKAKEKEMEKNSEPTDESSSQNKEFNHKKPKFQQNQKKWLKRPAKDNREGPMKAMKKTPDENHCLEKEAKSKEGNTSCVNKPAEANSSSSSSETRKRICGFQNSANTEEIVVLHSYYSKIEIRENKTLRGTERVKWSFDKEKDFLEEEPQNEDISDEVEALISDDDDDYYGSSSSFFNMDEASSTKEEASTDEVCSVEKSVEILKGCNPLSNLLGYGNESDSS